MKRNVSAGKQGLLAGVLAIFIIGQASAVALVAEGDKLPYLVITDQHGKKVEVSDDTQRLLIAVDNEGSGLVSGFLETQASNWLSDQHTVYLADIHKMPGFVASMFALPKLREKPYSIGLGREEVDLAIFPRQKGCVTVISVSNTTLGAPEFVCGEAELSQRLK